jgi:hypothetical protein
MFTVLPGKIQTDFNIVGSKNMKVYQKLEFCYNVICWETKLLLTSMFTLLGCDMGQYTSTAR